MKTRSPAHRQQDRLLSLYAALLKCDQAIIRSRHKLPLFDEICRHVVAGAGVRAVWIGLMGEPELRVWPQAHAGIGLDYLETLKISAEAGDGADWHGLAGRALAGNAAVWIHDLLTEPGLGPIRQHALAHHWHAAAALPLRLGESAVGVLCLYAGEAHAFDPLVRELLTQLAGNISHALEVFDREEQRRQMEFALQESEVRYSALFANSCMPLILLDPSDGRISDVNILAMNFYGWNQAEFSAMKIMDLYAHTPEQTRQEMALAAAKQRSFFESQHRLASGEVRDVEVFSRPINFDGQTYLMLAVHDVSQRQRLQTQMRSAQALTQSFLDHLPGVAFVKNSDSRLVLVNKKLGELLGRDPQSLIGLTARDLFPGPLADSLEALDREVLTSGRSKTYDESYRGRHSEASLFVMQDPSGERFLGGLSIDVTERFRANARTRAMLGLSESGRDISESTFFSQGLQAVQALTGSAVGWLALVSPDQAFLEPVAWTSTPAATGARLPVGGSGLWSDCVQRRQTLVLDAAAGLAPGAGAPLFDAPLQRLVALPVLEAGQVGLLVVVGDKETAYDQFDVETLMLMGNAIWRMVSRSRAEAALQERVHELVALNQDLAAAQMQLLQSEKMASIGQLAAGVAHEINNPVGFVKSNLGTLAHYVERLLGVVQAYAELEQRCTDQPAADCAEALAVVRQRKAQADFDYLLADLPVLIQESREGVERVGKIVLDLKNFSRAGEAEFAWSDLHEGIESTINVAWNELKYKAEVRRDFGRLPPVYCVASQINQVVLNLLVNAAQAIAGRGLITVRTGVLADEVWLEVQDTGCGMDAAAQARIFEPFYTTKPLGQGTGLGLSIAMGIVKQHHGTLTVSSAPEVGSTFRVSLPVNGGRDVAVPLS